MTRIEEIKLEMDETIGDMWPAYINNSAAFSALKRRYGELAGELVIEQISDLYKKHSEGEIFGQN